MFIHYLKLTTSLIIVTALKHSKGLLKQMSCLRSYHLTEEPQDKFIQKNKENQHITTKYCYGREEKSINKATLR